MTFVAICYTNKYSLPELFHTNAFIRSFHTPNKMLLTGLNSHWQYQYRIFNEPVKYPMVNGVDYAKRNIRPVN